METDEDDIVLYANALHEVDLFLFSDAATNSDYQRVTEWLMTRYEGTLREFKSEEQSRKRERSNTMRWLANKYARVGFDRNEREKQQNLECASQLAEYFRGNGKIRRKFVFLRKAWLTPVLYAHRARELANIVNRELDHDKISPEDIALCMEEYAGQLLDGEVYLSELVGALTSEYDRRIVDTEKTFRGYLLQHQRALKNVNSEIEEVDRRIEQIGTDTDLIEADRESLSALFAEKKSQLAELRRNETRRIRNLRCLAENLKDGLGSFQDLIEKLDGTLKAVVRRKDYVGSLERLGSRISKLRDALDELHDAFLQDAEKLKKGFLLFDAGAQAALMDAVEERTSIAHLAVRRKSDDASSVLKLSPISRDDKSQNEVDLSFLVPLNRK